MTASTKVSVKATFASGAFPTESNFADLIDSYMDTSPGLVAVASAALSGVGVPQFTSPSTVVFRKLTPIGIASMDASAAASAMTAIGILSAGQGAMKAATSAALLHAIGITSVGRQLAEVATTAAALTLLEFTTVGTVGKQLVAATTTAEANNVLAAPLSQYFESSAFAITAAGALTIAHGLASEPKLVIPLLRNVVSNLGYASGDRVFVNPAGNDPGGANARGLSIVTDATNINIRFGSDANSFVILNKSTGDAQAITNASWNFIVRAWA